MIREQNLINRTESCEPRIGADKSCEVKMQNLRLIALEDSPQSADRAKARSPRVFDYLDVHVRKLKVCAYRFRWGLEKTEHAFPAALSELHRQLAGVGFHAADA